MHHNLCKNCEHTFEGNFCSNCGQKTNTVRLNWHFVVEELKYTFLHINKGLLYTSKQLLTRPGDTVREFIEGKRVKHYKPILLIVVLAGLNGLLMHFLPVEEILSQSLSASGTSNEKLKFVKSMTNFMDWISKNFAFIELGMLPFFSFCSWLAFRKFGYNFIENIIINCFGSAQRLIMGVLLFPLEYLTIHSSFFPIISSISGISGYGLTIWLYFQLYKSQNLGSIVLRMILFAFLCLMMFILIIILTSILGAILIHNGYLDKNFFPHF